MTNELKLYGVYTRSQSDASIKTQRTEAAKVTLSALKKNAERKRSQNDKGAKLRLCFNRKLDGQTEIKMNGCANE